MNLLQTSRVVIVDDDPKDGLQFLEALSKIGIGATYFDGNSENYPKTPQKGVRLVALDMWLNIAIQDENQIIGLLIKTIEKIIADDNGPYFLIAWTQNTPMVDVFKKRLKKEKPDLEPLSIDIMNKNDMYIDGDKSKEFDPEKVKKKLSEIFKDIFPLDLIMGWEQSVHNAT